MKQRRKKKVTARAYKDNKKQIILPTIRDTVKDKLKEKLKKPIEGYPALKKITLIIKEPLSPKN